MVADQIKAFRSPVRFYVFDAHYTYLCISEYSPYCGDGNPWLPSQETHRLHEAFEDYEVRRGL